jgi:hypothetical protein
MVKLFKTSIFSLFFISLLILVSCEGERAEKLTKKWQIEGEDFTLEFRKDKIYQLREGHKLQQGSWLLKNDTIYLKDLDSTIKSNFAIKKLTSNNLTVEYNGEEIDFVVADSITNTNSQKP